MVGVGAGGGEEAGGGGGGEGLGVGGLDAGVAGPAGEFAREQGMGEGGVAGEGGGVEVEVGEGVGEAGKGGITRECLAGRDLRSIERLGENAGLNRGRQGMRTKTPDWSPAGGQCGPVKGAPKYLSVLAARASQTRDLSGRTRAVVGHTPHVDPR